MSGRKAKRRAVDADAAIASSSSSSTLPTGFRTLEREERFRHPSERSDGSSFPDAHRLIRPHLDSFDALFEGATNESEAASSRSGEDGSNGQGVGLLQLLVDDLEPRVVFDGKGDENDGLGNKLECACFELALEIAALSTRTAQLRTDLLRELTSHSQAARAHGE